MIWLNIYFTFISYNYAACTWFHSMSLASLMILLNYNLQVWFTVSSKTDTGKCKYIRISLLKGRGGLIKLKSLSHGNLPIKLFRNWIKSSFNEKQQFPVLILTVSACSKYVCDNLYSLLEESHFKVVKFEFFLFLFQVSSAFEGILHSFYLIKILHLCELQFTKN